MICRKVFFLAGLTLCVSSYGVSQTVTSARNGSWNDPSTWDGGFVPTSQNSTLVRIVHDVSLESGIVECYSVEITGKLSILRDATLLVKSVDGISGYFNSIGGTVEVYGAMGGFDGVSYGTSYSDLFFMSGSTFQHKGGARCRIPLAQWRDGSTLLLSGFTNSGYINLSYSSGWRQSFYNVIYDSPLQTTFVDFNGHLNTIRGDLVIRNTNSNALRLCTTQKAAISVAGSLKVEGNSEVWFNTTSDSVKVSIGRDFSYESSATGPGYLATRGRTHVSVKGRAEISSAVPLRFCSGSSDSTGVRKTTLDLKGGLSILSGGLIAPSPGKGVIIFSGDSLQKMVAGPGSLNGNFDFHFSRGSVVDLNSSILSGPGKVYIKGVLKVGSSSADGPFDTATGNIRTSGVRRVYPGAVIEYNGELPQFLTLTHPSDSTVDLIANGYSLELLKDVTVKNLSALKGKLLANKVTLSVHGDIAFSDSTCVADGASFAFAGGLRQYASFSGNTIGHLILRKSGKDVTLTSPLIVSQAVSLKNRGDTLVANGYLVLRSIDESGSGSCRVDAISEQAYIAGDVIVQRFLGTGGRIFRYISSPVRGASVSQLKDDFPVTGTFLDPSSGRGLNSIGPSLFYYDESKDEPWIPYPQSGYSFQHLLLPGRGYAAFIREQRSPVICDVSGVLNQGDIDLPMQYTRNASDEVRGWNLIGNPYASTIDWTRPEGWDKSPEISSSIAVRDNREGRFRYFDGDIGDLPDGRIAAGQAFWVRATDEHPFLKIKEEAKSENGAAFYRKSTNEVDYIQVTFDGPNVVDRLYIRKRKGSAKALDNYDAPKKTNDRLTFYTVTSDSIAVAINAMDDFLCEEKFQLVTSFSGNAHAVSGGYKLSWDANGLFNSADVRILDAYLNILTDANPYGFEINSDSASFDSRRFSLVIRNTKYVESPSRVSVDHDCQTSTVSVVLQKSSPIQLVAKMNGSVFYGDSLTHDATIFKIPYSRFSKRAEYLKIYARHLCMNELIDSVLITKETIPEDPVVLSAWSCHDDGTTIHLKSVGKKLMHVWFTKTDSIGMTSDTVVFFPTLKTAVIYVRTITPSGCSSDTVNVPISAYELQPPVLWSKDGMLFSSYAANEWYINNVLLSESADNIRLDRVGVYRVRGVLKGCRTAFVSYTFDSDNGVLVGPVPFKNELALRAANISDRITAVSIYDLSGNRVVKTSTPSVEGINIDTGHLKPGMYFAEVFLSRRRVVIKIMK